MFILKWPLLYWELFTTIFHRRSPDSFLLYARVHAESNHADTPTTMPHFHIIAQWISYYQCSIPVDLIEAIFKNCSTVYRIDSLGDLFLGARKLITRRDDTGTTSALETHDLCTRKSCNMTEESEQRHRLLSGVHWNWKRHPDDFFLKSLSLKDHRFIMINIVKKNTHDIFLMCA